MKKISTLVGIVIIIVAVAIIFGGVFAYQYFATQKNIPINNTQNINQPKNTAVTSQPSITITSPNGGESYSAGIIPVSFTTNAPVGNEYEMDIIGTPNNGSAYKYVDMYGYVQSGTTQNNSVNIPADIQTGKYKVVVIVYNGNSKNDPILCQDLSDNYFDINIAKITITSPSGGEVWKVGETHDITWNSSGADKVTIWVGNGNGAFSMSAHDIADNISASLGKYSWTIGKYDAWDNATEIQIRSTPSTAQAQVTITVNP